MIAAAVNDGTGHKPLRYAAYIRFNAADQHAKFNRGIQLQAIVEWINRQTAEAAGRLGNIYEDRITLRQPQIYPAFDRLLRDACNGQLQAVVVFDITLIARTPHVTEFYYRLLGGLNVKLCCVRSRRAQHVEQKTRHITR